MRVKSRNHLFVLLTAVVLAAAVATSNLAADDATQASAVSVGTADVGGVVSGPNGPEAGVWVIAETTELPTKFAKIVVTDDRGRYLIPDLPKANYRVWVRGYGLVDSEKQTGVPGTTLDLKAVPAPNPREAAQYYPAGYWYSLMHIPEKSEFPGTGAEGNGIPPEIEPGAATARTQIRRVHGVPSTGHQGHARASSGVQGLPIFRSRVGAPPPVRPGRRKHGRHPCPAGSATHA